MFGLRIGGLGGIGGIGGLLVLPYNPSDQFATGQLGAWYDPGDYTSLFQDAAGTTPVTAVAQPDGLMLDKRLGSVTYPTTGWTKVAGDGVVTFSGNLITITGATTKTALDAPIGSLIGSLVRLKLTYKNTGSAAGALVYVTGSPFGVVDGVSTVIANRNGGVTRVQIDSGSATFLIESITELPGNHLSQATATSRPITNTQGAVKYVTFDGIDDGLLTGPVTLGADMDFFIAVRRATAANTMLGFSGGFFGVAQATGTNPADASSGTPTYAVNGIPVNGGAVGTTRDQLNTAWPVASWVVIETRDLNLTAGWSTFQIGNFGSGFNLPGDVAGIILAPAGDATARQKNRQYLGAKVGLTLP